MPWSRSGDSYSTRIGCVCCYQPMAAKPQGGQHMASRRPAADGSLKTRSNATDLLPTALAYHAGGLTPIPHLAGYEQTSYYRTPRDIAVVPWGEFKERQPDKSTIETWFQHSTVANTRLELLCGSHPAPKAPDAAF